VLIPLAVIGLYLAAVTAFGSWMGRRGSVRDYMLAGQDVPAWAVAACVVATETSTLTFIGVPGMAYLGNWGFLQLAFGYVIGRGVIAVLLVPAYFRGSLVTSYELLGQRFGGGARTAAAAVFLGYRTFADGIRLHAAALVVMVALGRPDLEWIAIVMLGGAMILYTGQGGAAATIWTDVVQMFVYLLGAVVCLVFLLHDLPGGFAGAMASAGAAGKLQVLDLSFDLTKPYTLLAGIVGGATLTLATHGTDHYLVQRLLVARTSRDASIGIAVSGVVVLLQFVLFLVLGTLLWVHYGGRTFARGDEVLPTFVGQEVGGVWAGLVLAAVIASALSPSLNSMASSTVRDFYVPFVKPAASEAQQLSVARAATVAWGLLQIVVAIAAQGVQSALDQGLAVLSHASGPTVGAFLLAATRPRTSPRAVLGGMASGLAFSLLVARVLPWALGFAAPAWPWNVPMGITATVAVALAWDQLRAKNTRASC
jgi:SSS family solute:Na+ symporter